MKKKLLSLGLAVFIGSFSLVAQSQMNAIKKYSVSKDVPTLTLTAPNMDEIHAEDLERDRKGMYYRMGVASFTNLTTENSGLWTQAANGDRIWQLNIKYPGAEALSFIFKTFKIYDDSYFDVYDKSGVAVANRETKEGVKEHFMKAINLCFGNEMTLQLTEPKGSQSSEILIDRIMYNYRSTGNPNIAKINESESCEINVNCTPVGDVWQDEKRGVARILITDAGSQGYCSGSLVNNTAQDCKPLFLTAQHCGVGVTASDFLLWDFNFLYEATACTNPSSTGTLLAATKKIDGCVLLSKSDGVSGNNITSSDFILVQLGTLATEAATVTKLKSAAINAYWNGWDANNTATTGGAGIHHPAGDIKKISTYSGALVSTNYSAGASNTHWRVTWTSNSNGHGVTEGGSSGSPIFNNNGGSSRIVGTLSGGSSYCNALSSPDLYGKMSYHWTSNGTTSAKQLKPFLDPGNTGALVLNGSSNPCGAVVPVAPVANFSATPLSLAVGGTVAFTDLSTNSPTTWSWAITPATGWSYAGGTTASSQNPQIQFNTVGQYTVTLTASNANGSDAETKTNYITVTAAPTGPCAATSTSCTYESINNVTLGSINNTTGCTNYGNYTSMSTTLVKGQSYTASIIPQAQGTVGTAYTGDELAIYIDWNNDNDFTDVGERVGYVLVGAGWSNQFPFTVPATATTGTLRMRCRISYSTDAGPISSCGTTTDGEVEDYSVVVQNAGPAGIDENNILSAVNIYPNPFSENLTIDLTSVKDEPVSVQIFDLTGKLLKSVENQNGKLLEINMSGYAKGMYQVVLKTGDAKSIQRIVKQ